MFLKKALKTIFIVAFLSFSSCSPSLQQRFFGYMKGEYMILGTTSVFIIDTNGCFQDQGITFLKLVSIQATNQGIYSTVGVNEKFLPVRLSNGILYQGGKVDSVGQIDDSIFQAYAQKIY